MEEGTGGGVLSLLDSITDLEWGKFCGMKGERDFVELLVPSGVECIISEGMPKGWQGETPSA